VYDPALEYTPQFYEPSRGDVILNAVDARMPYWSPCDEVQHEAEAEGLAAALFKDDPRTNPFFVMVPRQNLCPPADRATEADTAGATRHSAR